MIRLENVTYMSSIGEFRGVDFHLPAGGAAVALGGRNSGKTDFINVCLGQEPVTEGTAYLMGKDASRLTRADHIGMVNKIGFVTQHITLLDNLTIAGNIGLPLSYHRGLSNAKTLNAVMPMMEKLGIARVAGRFPHQVGSDDAKMAMVARAAIMKPRLLVLDEPTAGDLDPAGFTSVMNAIKMFQREGVAMLILTCSPSMAAIDGAEFYCLAGRRLVRHSETPDTDDPTVLEFFDQIKSYTERQRSEIGGFYKTFFQAGKGK